MRYADQEGKRQFHRTPLARAAGASPPTNSKPAAAHRPQPAPAPIASGPAAINGVYTGEFQRPEGNSKLTFSVKATDNGSLTALFTFDPPPRKKGSSSTFKLTGKYMAGAKEYGVGSRTRTSDFTTIEPVGSGAQDALTASKAQTVQIGMNSPSSIVGALTRTDPQSGESNCGRFSATKDRTQPADLDQTML